MKKNPKIYSKLFIFGTAMVLSYFVMIQAYSVQNLSEMMARDREANVFRELQILNQKNNDLKEEIDELEEFLEQSSHKTSYLEAIEEEMNKYKRIAGFVDIEGSGIVIELNSEKVDSIWFVDIINELLNSGAEAISVNDIRLVEKTFGLDFLPNGQVMLNDSILTAPYSIKAIGDNKTLFDSLQQAGGVLQRLRKHQPEVEIELGMLENVEMKKVL